MVRPFLESATATSATVPVRDPSGSPLARVSGLGASTFFKSASVMGTGAAAGAAGVAGAAAGAGLCATAKDAQRRAVVVSRISLFICLLSPDCLSHVRLIDHADDAKEADGQSCQHNEQPPVHARGD